MKLKYLGTAVCLGAALACSAWGFAQDGAARHSVAGERSSSSPAACPVPASGAGSKADQPIAIVDGKPVYRQELTGNAAAQMLQIRQQEYKIQSDALDTLIRQKVVEEEANKQGISVDKLYEKEVDSKVPDPSEAVVRGYYLAVQRQVNQPFEKAEPQLAKVVKALEIQQARENYADALRSRADVAILLQPPIVETGKNDPARIEGNLQAPITIVEFGDYQCPFCSRAESTVVDLLKKYNGQVKLAFRDFPLSTIHPHAEGAAEASRCAEAQGKFWPMHDAMYADQSKLTEAELLETAVRLGMNRDSFAACLKSDRYKAAIQEDVQAGQRAGVTGTPAFFINGRFVNGSVPESQFEEIINSELAALKNKTDRADLATR